MRLANVPRVLQILTFTSRNNVYNSGIACFSSLSNASSFVQSSFLQNNSKSLKTFDGIMRHNYRLFHKSCLDLRDNKAKIVELKNKDNTEVKLIERNKNLTNRKPPILKETDIVEIYSEDHKTVKRMQYHIARKFAKEKNMLLLKMKDRKKPSYMLLNFEAMVEMRQKEREMKSSKRRLKPVQFTMRSYIEKHDFDIRIEKILKALKNQKTVEILLRSDTNNPESIALRRKEVYELLEPVGCFDKENSNQKKLVFLPNDETDQDGSSES